MAITTPVTSMGTKLKKGAVVQANLTSIAGLELTAEVIDTTDLSATNSYKSFIGGSKDAGEVKVKGFFVGTDFADTWMADFNSGATISTYSIEFPDHATTPSKWAFSGVVTSIATSTEVDNAVSFEATIKVSGTPTFTKSA